MQIAVRGLTFSKKDRTFKCGGPSIGISPNFTCWCMDDGFKRNGKKGKGTPTPSFKCVGLCVCISPPLLFPILTCMQHPSLFTVWKQSKQKNWKKIHCQDQKKDLFKLIRKHFKVPKCLLLFYSLAIVKMQMCHFV